MNRKVALSGLAVASVVGAGVWVIVTGHPQPIPNNRKALLALKEPNVPKPVEADKLYSAKPKVAKEKYKAFVQQYAASPDPVIQDQVGTARVKIGYLAAHQKDWTQARAAFLQADKETKGTGRSGDFGTVNEQGAYQAIVCLEASGDKEAARQQYTDFIKTRPLSSLCMACYRRLKRLNNGETTPEMDALVETATKQQDQNAKFEASVCGPRTLAYLCEKGILNPGKQPSDYKAFSKLCHTTDTGTSVSGMIDGLKAFGVNASAFRVNRQDLTKAKLPAILLWGDHYLTLLAVEDHSMKVYDTLTRSEREMKLPERDDPDFFVNLILLNGTEKDFQAN
jgi:hypothetical protein